MRESCSEPGGFAVNGVRIENKNLLSLQNINHNLRNIAFSIIRDFNRKYFQRKKTVHMMDQRDRKESTKRDQ